MEKTHIRVQKEFCGECSLALMRFVGKMKGVESVSPEEGKIVLTFDASVITEEDLLKITRDSIEKLGYRVDE
jgi:copper chaperone CopZ